MAFDRPQTTRGTRAPARTQAYAPNRPAHPGPPRPRFDASLIEALLSPALGYVPYSGIGSQKTPEDVMADMRLIGAALAKRGFTLRSGAAVGADTAFEEVSKGVHASKAERPREIFVAWKGIGMPHHLKNTDTRIHPHEDVDRLIERIDAFREEGGPEAHPPGLKLDADMRRRIEIRRRARAIAEEAHPAWHMCGVGARGMHTRNVHQVLGMDLDSPVRFAIAWTVDGNATGGTGQAIRISDSLGIPVLNLFDPVVRAEVLRVLGIAA